MGYLKLELEYHQYVVDFFFVWTSNDAVLVNAEKFRIDLMKIAMTTLSSKILSQDKEHFAKLAVDAVMRLKVC